MGDRFGLDQCFELPFGMLGEAVDSVHVESEVHEQAEEDLSGPRSRCERGPSPSA